MSPLPISAVPLVRLPGFDARAVPSIGADAHLPAVPAAALVADAMRRRFAEPPAWRTEVDIEPTFGIGPTISPAAVLVPIVLHEGASTVLLTERSTQLSNHSGQVAFPGGRADPGDSGPADTALREAWEEVALERRFCEVIGCLPTYTTGTGFVVTPVVALVRPGFALVPHPGEVADVFEVPLAFLMNPAHHHRHVFEWQGSRREWFSMPYDDAAAGRERFIWGATAGMLRNLYRFLVASER